MAVLNVKQTVTASSKSPLIGDRIASMTRAVGVKPCGGCKKRQTWLNEKHQQWRDRNKVEEV